MSSQVSLTHHAASIDGQPISYVIKRSLRARHIRLEIWPEYGLAVVVPRRCSLNEIPRVLQDKKHWILGKLEQHRQNQSRRAQADPNTVLYLGRPYKVAVVSDHADSVTIAGNNLLVSLSQKSRRDTVLERWYRRQAEKFIAARVADLSPSLGVTCRQFRVRAAKTRWGSCSHKGNLNFNWKLIMAPEPVIDYVIIHELAHLRQMNHSRRFWDLVQQHCPDWRDHKAWLREHQTELSGGCLAEEKQLPLC